MVIAHILPLGGSSAPSSCRWSIKEVSLPPHSGSVMADTREKALQDYRKKLLEHKEVDGRLKECENISISVWWKIETNSAWTVCVFISIIDSRVSRWFLLCHVVSMSVCGLSRVNTPWTQFATGSHLSGTLVGLTNIAYFESEILKPKIGRSFLVLC